PRTRGAAGRRAGRDGARRRAYHPPLRPRPVRAAARPRAAPGRPVRPPLTRHNCRGTIIGRPPAARGATRPAPAARAGRATMSESTRRPATPAEALRALTEGNRRFAAGQRLLPHQDADYRSALARAQRPFAAVFGCSDSRLPAEIIFDQGLGDLFVVRTAGHVAGTEVLGSIEYAVAVLDTPLVAVLGHDSCGAVAAALESVRQGTAPDGFIREVVERVMLSALAVRDRALVDPGAAVAEHIRYTADLLVRISPTGGARLSGSGMFGFGRDLLGHSA